MFLILQLAYLSIKEQRIKYNQTSDDTTKRQQLSKCQENIHRITSNILSLKGMTIQGNFFDSPFPYLHEERRGRRYPSSNNVLFHDQIPLEELLSGLAQSVSICKKFIREHNVNPGPEITTLLERL